ncbi:hypothetical protein JWJ90_17705 [Desulfobulbus rhabdoformis]|uniref:hypothetical protein n=1 Tax=Desulfobulbus rhabdoformis TaxID=34032 RepID=UPI001962DD7A|nr:hypothetical protein [Desulfobulbus rhabdoformis]MBM9616107.1 hypothetical protein [Desulfobulbus rhabdoformis]
MGPEEKKLEQNLAEVKLLIPDDLYRAFQRCLWIRIQETGQSQLELMEEVVKDFLIKHGC